MPTVKTEITWGNLASITTTLIAVGAIVFHFSNEQSSRRAKVEEFDRTLARLAIERAARRKLVDERIEFIMRERSVFGERIAAVEAQSRLILDAIKRVETKLDRTPH